MNPPSKDMPVWAKEEISGLIPDAKCWKNENLQESLVSHSKCQEISVNFPLNLFWDASLVIWRCPKLWILEGQRS